MQMVCKIQIILWVRQAKWLLIQTSKENQDPKLHFGQPRKLKTLHLFPE